MDEKKKLIHDLGIYILVFGTMMFAIPSGLMIISWSPFKAGIIMGLSIGGVLYILSCIDDTIKELVGRKNG